MTPNNPRAIGKAVRFSDDPTEIGCHVPDNIQGSDPVRSPADPTVEDAEDASDIEERIELFHSDGTCPKPLEPEHEADARGIPLRRILINQYFAVTLGNVTATAASEPPQDLMPSEEGFTIGRPVFYFVGFLFGLYLWLTAYAAYISLRRVFFS